jgi:hypothetical protein
MTPNHDAAPAPAPDGLLPRMRALALDDDYVSHAELASLIEAHAGREQLPLAEWHEVVSFASDQCARWGTRWLFSPAAAPDAAAEAELAGWRALYAVLAEALLARVPEVRPQLERQHEITALRHVLRRQLEETEGRTGRRVVMAVLSQVARAARPLGLSAVAARLDATALYPPGSVGRVIGTRSLP